MRGGSAEPCDLDATSAIARIRDGALSAEELLRSCLLRITEREADIRAFVSIDADGALAAARRIDERREPAGPLGGIPFGVKDVIDVLDMETRYGSDLPIGRIAGADAAIVAQLRRAGGVPIGKTETVEFAATGRIPPTRNPRDPQRSPGGSSSGSAAAVAAGMVPFALGTQTGGSLVRPASYTGIYALKPSHGLVSLDGVHPHAPSLDCVGWHARSVADLGLLASIGRFPPPRRIPPARPDALRVAICRTPQWHHLDADGRAVFEDAVENLRSAGVTLHDLALPPPFRELSEAQLTIMRGEARVSFRRWHDAWPDRMHPALAALFEGEDDPARAMDAFASLVRAHRIAATCRLAFADLAASFDAVLAPAATGEAPILAEGPGSPAMNRMWSALHVPIVALPAGAGAGGLPIGLQLIGRFGEDQDLLHAAKRIDQILHPPG